MRCRPHQLRPLAHTAPHLKACTGSEAPRCATTASRNVALTVAVPATASTLTLLIWLPSIVCR